MHHSTKDFWDYFQIGIGTLTFFVLIYYAYKTAKLHTEARRQNKYSICPFLIGKFESVAFRIYNYGRGPAVNISITRHSPGMLDLKASQDVLIPEDRIYFNQTPGSSFDIYYANMFGDRYYSNIVIDDEVENKCILMEFRELSKRESNIIKY